MEPSAQDVAAVSQAIGEQPAPQVAPQQPAPQPQAQPVAQPQQQPVAPVSQPAPSSQPQDPFSQLFQPAPAEPVTQPQEPVAPVQQPQPTQPTEPVTTPQPQQTPTEPTQPSTPGEPQYQTFEEYMAEITANAGDPAPLPDASKINPDNEEDIKGFFDQLVNTAVERAQQSVEQSTAIQTRERQLWDAAFDKYGSLKGNKPLRDMVHSIRMGEFNKGIAITPTQAADRLLDALKAEHQRGVSDNQVITTIQDVQPQGGGGQPVATTTDMDNVLASVQTGGETALAAYLDGQVKAGKL